ncbi:MAG: type IV secretion system protein, partial [Paracoccaceae bacterium]|nr:type IV secretion system protein [Paracoccaceae bacterium]
VGLLFAAIGVFVVISAQLMLAVMLIIGPVAIAATLNEKLSFLFTAWIKSTITAALIQMLAVIVIAVTANAMQDAMPSNYDTVSSMGAVMGVVFIGIVGVAFMAGVPGIAANLAGGGVHLGSIVSDAMDKGQRLGERAIARNASTGRREPATGATTSERIGGAAAGVFNRLRGLD